MIRRELVDAYGGYLAREYPGMWRRMASAWRASREGSKAWFLYGHSYLFRTGGFGWCVDPVRGPGLGSDRLGGDPSDDLAGLDLALLTHAHSDHMDDELVARLASAPGTTWVVPDHMEARFREMAGEPRGDVRIVAPGDVVETGPARVTALPASHAEFAGGRMKTPGVPQTGFMVECAAGRMLFPGDIRTYCEDIPGGVFSPLHEAAPVDWLFAHVWLGRGSALGPRDETVDAFCRHQLAARPVAVVLGHLHEVRRDPPDYWGYAHAGLVMDRLLELAPHVRVEFARIGGSLELSPE